MRVLFGGALGLAAWLLRYDLARRTVRQHGLVRFVAIALLAGYGWLLVAGVLGMAWGNVVAIGLFLASTAAAAIQSRLHHCDRALTARTPRGRAI